MDSHPNPGLLKADPIFFHELNSKTKVKQSLKVKTMSLGGNTSSRWKNYRKCIFSFEVFVG